MSSPQPPRMPDLADVIVAAIVLLAALVLSTALVRAAVSALL
jgi:hypothetical protein